MESGSQIKARRWYSRNDVVPLKDTEYLVQDGTPSGATVYDTIQQKVHGRFQCVVKGLDDTYTVIFAHREHTAANTDLRRWEKLRRFADLLVENNVIADYYGPTRPDDIGLRQWPYFDFQATGIKDKSTATVIHNAVLNYVYLSDYSDRLGVYIRNLESMRRHAIGREN